MELGCNANKNGDYNLQLLVTVRVKVGKESGDRDLPVMKRLVHVMVNPIFSVKKFLVQHVEWILGSIFGAIFGWIAKHLHHQHKHRHHHNIH